MAVLDGPIRPGHVSSMGITTIETPITVGAFNQGSPGKWTSQALQSRPCLNGAQYRKYL